jgi:hypothetical protein
VIRLRRLVKGCSHARLVSLKREYSPGFTPRHAKPALVDDFPITQPMELAA